jgi:hypothetical protein
MLDVNIVHFRLVEKLSGINTGELNPIPRSLAWMVIMMFEVLHGAE